MPLTQSEDALEKGLIKTLTDMAYEYVEINEETNLISNFKRQLEKHNAKELASHGRTELTDNEFNKVMLYLEGGTTFEKAKKLRDCCHWNLTMDSVYGLNFSTVTNGVRMNFKFPIRLR